MRITEPFPGVFVFHVPRDVRRELHELIEWRRTRAKTVAPNSMNKYGLVLDKPLRTVMRQVQAEYVAPLAVEKYNIRLKLDPYAFVVDYTLGTQRSLAAHDDTSDVTLNLCLGKKWTGGELVFHGPGKQRFEIEHRVGQAIVHLGSQVHRAKTISSGTRSNLILWCQRRR